jgi:guanidinoacetate N-methyltransferase
LHLYVNIVRIIWMITKTKNHILKNVKKVLKYKYDMSEKLNTLNSRLDIGFPAEIEEWKNGAAMYDEHSLKINGHPVMEDWELGYMKDLAEIATTHPGQILEVGYGMGLSARAIQSRKPNLHIIIDCNADVIKRAEEDLGDLVDSSKVQLLEGFWQDVTPSLADESLDGILFDTYPLKKEEIHKNHFWFFEEAHRLLKPGGILTYYSDEVTEFSPEHMAKLEEAGFNPENIRLKVCTVKPPEDCEYWQHNTIVAPIVTK